MQKVHIHLQSLQSKWVIINWTSGSFVNLIYNLMSAKQEMWRDHVSSFVHYYKHYYTADAMDKNVLPANVHLQK